MLLFDMNSYLLSVSVIVFLTSIISLILPDGKMGKCVKSFFSILILLVIISPIFKLSEFDLESSLSEISYTQDDYLYYINETKTKSLEKDCETLLEKHGVAYAVVDIEYFIDSEYVYSIKKATIFLDNAVINKNDGHININEELIETVSKYLNIEKGTVKVNE